ncbi:hypothetical protein N7535_000282 [Penicillium sp. DV-2018c]|nr:hypothetical protein N7461_006475 [Penicillium sp. DV-2018c]KAJ5581662.1 hypothetical protein N7535_000282 [Penicillium sp. DV-2018c]
MPSVVSSTAPSPLESLERVGPVRHGRPGLFLYYATKYGDWVTWWLQTSYGSNNPNMPWASQHGAAAKTWKEFS